MIYLIIVLTLTLWPASCFASPNIPDYAHREELLKKNDALNVVLAQTFGKDNPFTELTAMVEVTTQLQEHLVTRAQHRSNRLTINQCQALSEHLAHLDAGISAVLRAFVDNQPRHEAIAQLTTAVHNVGEYIGKHLSHQAKKCQAMRQLTRRQERFFGPLASVGIFGGTFKYVVMGILGVVGLATIWKVYRALTHEARDDSKKISEHLKEVARKRGRISKKLRKAVQHYVSSNLARGNPEYPSSNYGKWQKIQDRIAWCFQWLTSHHKKRKAKRVTADLEWIFTLLYENQYFFDLDEKTAEKIGKVQDCLHRQHDTD